MTWSLRKKLYSAFGLIIAAVFALGVVVFVSLRDIDRISNEESRLAHAALDAETMNKLLIQGRRKEKDYFMRADAHDKQLHAEAMRDFDAVAKRLEGRIHADEPTLVKGLELARTNIDRYESTFAAAAAAFDKRGTAETGLQAEFRKAAHALEQVADAEDDDALRILVLRIRRSEKDFLLRTDNQYADQVRAIAGEIKAHVAKLQAPPLSPPAVAPALIGDTSSGPKPKKDNDDKAPAPSVAPAPAPALRIAPARAAAISQAIESYVEKFEAAVGATKDLSRLSDELHDVSADTEKGLATLEGDAIGMANASDEEVSRVERTSELVFLGVLAAVLLLSVVVARLLSTQLGVAVAALATGTRAISTGDLRARVEVKSGDELGALGGSFNQMVDSLRDMTSNISTATVSMEEVVTELTATVAEQAASLQQQAASVSETVATASELARSSEQVSDIAKRVLDGAARSVETSARGLEAIRQSVGGMNDVREQVQNIARTILDLSTKTQQIGTIITTVDDFAERSSLLALNASIEAARAGEAGRAFSVVAGEVKSLAEQSQRATERVRGILSDIQRTTHTAVLVTEEGEKRVERGVELTSSAGDIIGALSSAIESAAESAKQIAAAARQQTNGIDQISTAMSGIEQFSRQNVQATKQTETTAHSIAAVSKQLKTTTAQYRM
jgi:methyl-accepting chemotaxis protein